MRVYLDSSALVKRSIVESESEALRAELRAYGSGRDVLMSSELAVIEVSRAIRTHFDTSYAAVADFVDGALSGLSSLPVDDEVVSLARRLNPDRLRSLDAIHVASAMLLDSDVLITYDDRMADAARLNGVRVSAPGR